jgi:hypothetical protein
MSDQLESALVLALRNTIKWESGTHVAPLSGTLAPVNPDLPFDAKVYQQRDRQLAYRDLMVGAAVVEVSVQVGDVWNYSVLKPTLQGPAETNLPFSEDQAGQLNTQLRHVTNVSVPYDAARYADADLYGRDAIVYEVLARACNATFADPSIPLSDATGTIIPSTSIWSLGEGTPARADINPALPLNRDLFKTPDRNLADRDNQLAGYVAQLCQVLKNPFEHALRLYTQIESYGTVQREPDIYALINDDGTHRVFQTEPALPGANQIIYNIAEKTLQWQRERVDEVHVPQIYALAIPGIEVGQTVETLTQIPDRKDAQYWRGKAGQLAPKGVGLQDTEMYLNYTNNDAVYGGVMQYDCASFTVPAVMDITLDGSVTPGAYRLSVLAQPNGRVELAGIANISSTTGTLGGATFEINVPSGSIADKLYMVDGGDGIYYSGSLYLPGEVFAGTSAVTTYSQYGATDSSVRQSAINFLVSLPAGPYYTWMEYTNISGETTGFRVKADYIATGSEAVPVVQNVAPLPFSGQNGDVVTSPIAVMDVRDNGQFQYPIQWTGGTGQLHIRKLVFESKAQYGRYAISGTFAGSHAVMDALGENRTPSVFRWQFSVASSSSGAQSLVLNYTDEPSLPVRIEQIQVQRMYEYDTTPLSAGFQGWRQECLDRAERAIQQGYTMAVKAYGTDVPTFSGTGSVWSNESTENWMAFCEIYNPRLRSMPSIPTDGITAGHQYEVTVGPVTYNGTTYTDGQKFYGVVSAGTDYSGGSVAQVGAFKLSQAGHVGKPVLMPRGLYYDDATDTVLAAYDTAQSVPIVVTCQPWMVQYGLYVAQAEFWMPECLGFTLPSDAVPIPYLDVDFVAAPTAGTLPLVVNFTNLSTNGGGASWTWDFGD